MAQAPNSSASTFRTRLRAAAQRYVEGRSRAALARSAAYIEMLSDEQLAEAGLSRDTLQNLH